jgi:thiamine biosynthesis protein ThiC
MHWRQAATVAIAACQKTSPWRWLRKQGAAEGHTTPFYMLCAAATPVAAVTDAITAVAGTAAAAAAYVCRR